MAHERRRGRELRSDDPEDSLETSEMDSKITMAVTNPNREHDSAFSNEDIEKMIQNSLRVLERNDSDAKLHWEFVLKLFLKDVGVQAYFAQHIELLNKIKGIHLRDPALKNMIIYAYIRCFGRGIEGIDFSLKEFSFNLPHDDQLLVKIPIDDTAIPKNNPQIWQAMSERSMTTLKNVVDQQSREFNAFQEKITRGGEEFQKSVQESISTLAGKVSNLGMEFSTLNVNTNRLTERLNGLDEKVSTLNVQRNELVAKVEDLAKKLAESHTKIAALESGQAKLHETSATIKTELTQALKAQHESLQKEVASAAGKSEAGVRDLRTETQTQLQQQQAGLRQELAAATSQTEGKLTQALAGQNESLRKEIVAAAVKSEAGLKDLRAEFQALLQEQQTRLKQDFTAVAAQTESRVAQALKDHDTAAAQERSQFKSEVLAQLEERYKRQYQEKTARLLTTLDEASRDVDRQLEATKRQYQERFQNLVKEHPDLAWGTARPAGSVSASPSHAPVVAAAPVSTQPSQPAAAPAGASTEEVRQLRSTIQAQQGALADHAQLIKALQDTSESQAQAGQSLKAQLRALEQLVKDHGSAAPTHAPAPTPAAALSAAAASSSSSSSSSSAHHAPTSGASEGSKVDLAATIFTGDGYTRATLGHHTSFALLFYNTYGSPVSINLKDLVVKVEGPRPINPTLETLQDYSVKVAYLPVVNGNYTISLSYRGSPLPNSPFRVELQRDYAANFQPQKILSRSDFNHLEHPWAITFDSEHRMYVTDPDTHSISVFNAEFTSLRRRIGSKGTAPGKFEFPRGVAINSKSELVVCDAGSSRIQVLDLEGNFLNSFAHVGTGAAELAIPRGIAVGPGDDVYVVDTENHRIQVFRANGAFIRSIGKRGHGNGEFTFPLCISIYAPGNEFAVSDCDNHRVQIFDLHGNWKRTLGKHGSEDEEFDKPSGVAYDLQGNILVTDINNHRVQVFSNEGAFLTKFGTRGRGPGEFDEPRGIAVDLLGNIYVADFKNQRIQMF